jgi:hypothetical protein
MQRKQALVLIFDIFYFKILTFCVQNRCPGPCTNPQAVAQGREMILTYLYLFMDMAKKLN